MASHRAEDFRGLATHIVQVFDHEVSAPVPIDSSRHRFPIITGPTNAVTELTARYRTLECSSTGPLSKAVFAEPVDSDVPCAYPDDIELIDLLATVRMPR